MPRLSRMVLTLVLTTLLVTTAALAQTPVFSAVRPLGPAASASQDLFARLWSFLTQPWSKNGCEVDPSGRCLPQGSGLAPGDNGCQVDPDGRCRAGQSPVQSKNGCELDPNGRCTP